MAQIYSHAQLYEVGLSVAKGATVGAALWSAGSSTAAVLLLPAVLQAINHSPKLAANQWAHFYWTLSAIVPKCELYSVLACGAFAYLEYKNNKAGLAWKIWSVAMATHPFGWMWVWNFMLDGSNKIVDAGKSIKEPPAGQVRDLIEEFTWKMGVRAFFPWVVGALAFAATQSS